MLIKLFTLDRRKAMGSDGISARLLTTVAPGPGIKQSLTSLFNVSLECRYFPNEWKQANIHDVSNYRPVSVILVIAKIFKSLVHNQLYDNLETNGLLSPCAIWLSFRTLYPR